MSAPFLTLDLGNSRCKLRRWQVARGEPPRLRAVPGGLMKALEQSLRQPRKDLAHAGRSRRRAGRRSVRGKAA